MTAPVPLALSLFVALCATASHAAHAQTVPPGGLETQWDVRAIATGLVHNAEQSAQTLAAVSPQNWSPDKAAPNTYVVQWQTAQQQARDVVSVAHTFALHTEKLSAALDVYFRMEALERSERALNEGAQRYDTRANADRLAAAMAQTFDGRERLRQYIGDLSAALENNFAIADQEAQRCRSDLSRQPPTRSTRSR